MSNITVFANAGLPSVASLSTALQNIEKDVGPAGVAILKMDKTGHWVFGADQTEIESDSTWAVNPFSFIHGFIAWGDGEVLGEKMVPVAEPLPELGEAPTGAKRGWEIQIGFAMKCLSGEDEGLEVRYTVTSVGGKKAAQSLAAAIATQVDKDPSKPVPVVTLDKEYYQHKSFGRIYTPVFNIEGWLPMSVEAEVAEEAPAAEEAEAESESPRRRRRPAV